MSQRFGHVLRAPFVPWLLATSTLARLPYSVDALAILLYVHDRTGSFAIGGLVSASAAISAAITTPLLGRLVDRLGQTRVLVATTFVHAAGLLLLVALGEAGAPTIALAGCAVLAGMYPPLSPAFRSLWETLLDHDRRAIRTALALDAIMLEVVFIGGPLTAAVIFALWSPAASLVAFTIVASIGTLGFAASPPSRAWRGARHESGLLGPLRSPGLRTLLLATFPSGIGIGTFEVALPAFAVEHGSRSIAGVALACFAAGSLVGGIVYGTRAPDDVRRSYLLFACLLPVGITVLAAAGSPLGLFVLAPLAGVVLAPLTAAQNELTAVVAPEGTVTEAYSWSITAIVAGGSAGAALGGTIVEASSWRTALLVAGAMGFAGAVVALSRRATLVPSTPARP